MKANECANCARFTPGVPGSRACALDKAQGDGAAAMAFWAQAATGYCPDWKKEARRAAKKAQ
jgi:hypothetical protein